MNIKIQDAEEYIPYGEDWEKEMMKLPKKFLIEQLKNKWQQSQQPKVADGWISVEDRLPSENREVLAIETDVFGDMDIIIAQWTGEYWYSPFKARKVTHWQYLPSKPKNNQ